MKKFAQLILLVTIVGLIQLGCDSVTDSDINNSNSTTSLNSEISQSSEGDDVDVIVDDENTEWSWVFESGSNGNGAFVSGPAITVIGSGSAQFILEDDETGLALTGKLTDGAVPLADIEKLEYNTYQSVSSSNQTVSLQLNINYNEDEEGWQGRLAFEPYYYTEEVLMKEWQTWDALTQGGWWATGAPGNEVCSQNEPCSWNEVLEAFPDAEVRAESNLGDISLIHFKAGSNWGPFDGNVDGFTINIGGEESVYNFEAEDEEENGEPDNNPLTIEDCKEGGWEEFGFRNQGQCVRYVNTGQDSREESQGVGENGEDEENGENGEESDENGDLEEETDENGTDATNPSSIQDCQNGGWAEYGFRNQGQCVRYVNTGQDSREESQDDGENGDDEENGENGEESDENGDSEDENGEDSGDNGDSDDEENGENGEGSEDDENGDSDNGNDSDQNGENGDGDENDGENGDNGSEGDDEGENGDGETTTAAAGPSSVEECRDGGWEEYGFRNQGECVRTVRNGG